MQFVTCLVLLAIFLVVHSTELELTHRANEQRSPRSSITIPLQSTPYPTHDPTKSSTLPKRAYIPHPDELAYSLKNAPKSPSFANIPSRPTLSRDEQRDIDLKRQLFSRVLVRCPIGSNTPSYHLLQTLGFKLQKDGRHEEAKRCFQDAQAKFTSRVSLVGTGPRPDGPEAIEAARRSIPMAERRGSRVQDPMLQRARGSEAGIGRRRRRRHRKHKTARADTAEGGKNVTQTKPLQPGGPVHGSRSSFTEVAADAGASTSQPHIAVEPWRKHPLSLWMTDGGLRARLAQVYSTQLAIQRRDGRTPFDT